MGDKTKIEWSDATWNPITGCTKISIGCKNCYAERVAGRFWNNRKFTDIQYHTSRLDIPLRWTRPRKIFVCSMGDLFHEFVALDYILQVFDRMEQAKQHTFMVLTKRPKRTYEFCQRYGIGDINDWPQNVLFGVTAENQETADLRIPILMKIPASIRFLSVEPMLDPININQSMYDNKHSGMNCFGFTDGFGYEAYINWVICGSESGPNRRNTKVEWIRDLRDQCKEASVSFFLKQMEIDGKLVKMPELDGKVWGQMPL